MAYIDGCQVFLGRLSLYIARDVTSSSRLGRPRNILVPPEYTLAQVVSQVVDRHVSWNTSCPINEWMGVTCTETGNVDVIAWSFLSLRGNFSFNGLPRTLRRLSVGFNALSGEVELENLPENMAYLFASYNEFYGGLEMRYLPRTMTDFYFSMNKLQGRVDLSSLPPNIIQIDISKNKDLVGILRKCDTPVSLVNFDISETKISRLAE